MTHVVTENCSQCRFTDCAVTCPVQCFHGDGERLYIDPEVCIDCNACIPACPVQAIREEFHLTPEQEHWREINAERAKDLPVISAKQQPLPTAEARRAELGF
ncbi:ferredoxin family protein [Pseudorhodoplanes sp.]|jgi:ferredoxin|uniref:ferredoxin family protein n=1 Tax=Pseudorhodoplanes sp. TaxID=1934341 RepID=UPI002CF30DE4|nr:ferredoxin family protein [Pseudorhodoplanes sp.]HWV43739.1 ferredoxin family protein [Pseudorhodoplanes sp.]